jgi:hypothetical protein
MRYPCCLSISPYQLLNVSTSLHETWYVYHGTWVHLNGVVHTSSLQSMCLYLYPLIVATQRPDKNVTSATKRREK